LLRAFVENAPVAIGIFDRDMRYLAVSRRWLEDYRLGDVDLVGRAHYDVFPEIPERWREAHRRGLAGESLGELEDSFERADGQWQHARWALQPWREADGSVGGIVIFTEDITARVQAVQEKDALAAQLQASQRLESIGRLAGGIAHDFNNMLGVIIGCAELALDIPEATPALAEELQRIRATALRSADLTRQLLAFARHQSAVPVVLDLNEAVSGTLSMLERLIGENIDLVWAPATDLGQVKIDPAQLDQILTNLCINARDAIADTGRITIETANFAFDDEYCGRHHGFKPGDYVMLAVSDDGGGMDAETLARVFEPYFSTKTGGKGTGLGLSTVYGIVKQNDGFINVYSEPGGGTTFKIYLVRETVANETPVRPAPPAQPVAGQATILLVEDDEMILELAAKMLGALGYRVLAANSPFEAMATAARHDGSIDLLVTDVIMPELNGRELSRRLQAGHPGLRTLYISGYTANVIAHRGLLEDGIMLVEKPFTRQQLADKVREALTSGVRV